MTKSTDVLPSTPPGGAGGGAGGDRRRRQRFRHGSEGRQASEEPPSEAALGFPVEERNKKLEKKSLGGGRHCARRFYFTPGQPYVGINTCSIQNFRQWRISAISTIESEHITR